MKKIKIILSLMLFLTPTICFAKTIKIDRTYYNVDNVLELSGLLYDANNDTITLTNANLISIQTDNDLKIILNGENTINNDRSVSECIKGSHVTIEGNGTLNLISASRGVSANTIDINNTTIYGDVFTSMFVLTGNDTNMNIKNSNVIFKDNESAFYIINGGVNIDESNIIIKKTISLGSDTLKHININNSNLDVVECNNLFIENGIMNIDSNSKVFVYCKNGLDSSNFSGENIKYYGSIDNNNYHENIKNDDKYLKVMGDFNLESKLEEIETEKEKLQQEINKIEEKSNELDNQEEQNKRKEKELENKELELLELNDGLNKKEEALMNKENGLISSRNELDVKTSSIKTLSNILLGKQNEISTLQTSIEKEKLEIESLKRYLNLKENELKNKENKLLLEVEESDLEIDEEITDYDEKEGEVLEKNLLENSSQYNQVNTNYINKLGNIFYLLLSYIGGIITHVFTKRRING